MSAIFTSGATVVTVRSPLFPFKVDHLHMQAKQFTEGGTLLVQELADPIEVMVFHFENLSDTERNNLYSFYNTTVDGAATAFTFTDPDAVDWTVKWMDDQFDFEMVSEGRWDGIVTLLDVS